MIHVSGVGGESPPPAVPVRCPQHASVNSAQLSELGSRHSTSLLPGYIPGKLDRVPDDQGGEMVVKTTKSGGTGRRPNRHQRHQTWNLLSYTRVATAVNRQQRSAREGGVHGGAIRNCKGAQPFRLAGLSSHYIYRKRPHSSMTIWAGCFAPQDTVSPRCYYTMTEETIDVVRQ